MNSTLTKLEIGRGCLAAAAEQCLLSGSGEWPMPGRHSLPWKARERRRRVLHLDRRLPTVRIVPALQFRDGSHLVMDSWRLAQLGLGSRSPYLVLDTNGLGRGAMWDSPTAVRNALRLGQDLYVRQYVSYHGSLPKLTRDLQLRALESASRAVRMAAIAGLSGGE